MSTLSPQELFSPQEIRCRHTNLTETNIMKTILNILAMTHYATRLTLQAQKTLNLTDCAVVRLSILVNYNIINLTYYVFVI